MLGTESSSERARQDALRKPGEDVGSVTVRVAQNRSELTSAYELVYRQYVAKGYIAPNAAGIVYYPTFGLPTTRTVIATLGDEHVVGTLTMVGDNIRGLHLEQTFPHEVARLRRGGSRLAEVTSLCTDPETSAPRREVLFELTKFAVHHSYLRGYDDVLLAVHPRHYPFYWRTLRAVQISPCRPYAAVSGPPAICCRINRASLNRRMCRRMRELYFGVASPPSSSSYYDGPPVSPADHQEFCRRLALGRHHRDNERKASRPAA